MHIFFIILFGFSVLQGSDKSYLYQNDIDIDVKIVAKTSVKVTRKKDNKVLLATKNMPLFVDKSNKALEISYRIVPKTGGFDVNYRIKNPTKKSHLMPDFHIPGIGLNAKKTLDILNTNTKHYMEKRELSEFKRFGRDYFSVSAFSQIDNSGVRQEKEMHYGADTLSAYSPVISVKTKDFAVGSSLNYPLLKYEDKTKTSRGRYSVLMNKLYPKMRIHKDANSWRFSYSFDKKGLLKGRIGAKKEYRFTIPVRFSKPKYWLLTLHPYKEYFLKHYPIKNKFPKDVKPILLVNFAFYGDSITQKSERGWAWILENVDKKGYSYLPLKQVSRGLSQVMQLNGYERILFATFSGVYDTRKSPKLIWELPFQFITNLEKNMQKELDESLNIFKEAGQKYGFWWGIAGMMPVDKKGEVISFDTWLPHSDIPFILKNSTHKEYAQRQLLAAKDAKADSLSLDAYVRMEENSRIKWLKQMKKTTPKIKFVLEQQVDFMHSDATIILQPENPAFENIDYSKSMLEKPAIFSHYLNPKAEVQVWLKQNITKDKTAYIKRLVEWGYTPIIMLPSSGKFNHDVKNVTKRIVDNSDLFIPVKNLNNSKIASCFDGFDNDKDGKTDWPWDEDCLSASDWGE